MYECKITKVVNFDFRLHSFSSFPVPLSSIHVLISSLIDAAGDDPLLTGLPDDPRSRSSSSKRLSASFPLSSHSRSHCRSLLAFRRSQVLRSIRIKQHTLFFNHQIGAGSPLAPFNSFSRIRHLSTLTSTSLEAYATIYILPTSTPDHIESLPDHRSKMFFLARSSLLLLSLSCLLNAQNTTSTSPSASPGNSTTEIQTSITLPPLYSCSPSSWVYTAPVGPKYLGFFVSGTNDFIETYALPDAYTERTSGTFVWNCGWLFCFSSFTSNGIES